MERLLKLVDNFQRDLAISRSIKSANAADDAVIKAAITGFCYHCQSDEWDLGHYQFVRDRADREFPTDRLSEFGENGANVKLFYAIALGYLLGLYQKAEMDDQEFFRAEMQLPGVTFSSLARLTETQS